MNPIQYSYTQDDQEKVMTLLPLPSHLLMQVALQTFMLEDAVPTADMLNNALEEGLHRLALMHHVMQPKPTSQALMEHLTGHIPLSNAWLNHTN